ncbi:MAG: hypothetical protein G3M70_08315 [Candidatus Nitronauta litoralis]|uniref:Uncharacterized protein n=1 Tax=Candidatus Nitronauta litoralis TaxID=2705533 RepID=A0A7T0G038_9BACT|nr:MAG: hypothetical protein G3M70_08315 [Candidatus Nitronauta litoralis]
MLCSPSQLPAKALDWKHPPGGFVKKKKKTHSARAVITTWSLVLFAIAFLFWKFPFSSNPKIKSSSGFEIELPDTKPWQENMALGQLRDLFINCKTFWEREEADQPCSLEHVSQSPYYFSQTPGDRPKDEGVAPVTLLSGNRENFSAEASHENSPVVWTINSEGKFKCSLGLNSACVAITHLSRKEILKEVREYYGDVPDDVEYIEIK